MALPSSFKITSAIALSLFAVLFFAPAAHADSITISPPKFELFATPGDIVSDNIKISNNNPQPLILQSTVEDFTANGDEGGINFIEDPAAPITNFSLARWVTVEPSRFTVQPNSDSVIKFSIKVPKGAEPGGHYASILITRAGEKVDGGASVNSTIGSLLLLRVSGAVTENLSVDTFQSDDTYYQHGPVTFNLRTKNNGNVHVAPKGEIVVTNMFGKKVDEISLTSANVLPGAFRAVKTTWNSVPIGHFTATLVANYGQSNQSITASTSFTVIPGWLILLVLVVLILIILMITGRKKFKRLINRLTSD